jgi:hypothetical protein
LSTFGRSRDWIDVAKLCASLSLLTPHRSPPLFSPKFSSCVPDGKTKERYIACFSEQAAYIVAAPSKRTRNGRRQPTPPLIIQSGPKKDDESGVSRVNKEIATLIARKDPLLNQVSKKSKTQIARGNKGRVTAKMEKAAAKAVWEGLQHVLMVGSIGGEDGKVTKAGERD